MWDYLIVAFWVIGALLLIWISNMIVYLSNNEVGIVEKLWSFKGSVTSGIMALHGEAGYQAAVMRGGFHLFMPFQYRIHRQPLVTVPQGEIGYVFARDGVPLAASQALACNLQAADFQDTQGFLEAGGQRGTQRKLLREGTYAINTAQFVVMTAQRLYALALSAQERAVIEQMAMIITDREGYHPVVLRNNQDEIGIITVHDGPGLPQNTIIAPAVGTDLDSPHFHNNFQDPEAFLAAGGYRGRQYQVLTEGSYFINRLFATIELAKKTVVEVGHVGVVVSYTGDRGSDISGDAYRHGELVESGCKGVWKDPLLPGKYAFNIYAGRVISVPTTNFILKWVQGEAGSYGFDANLAEISLITKDAFEPLLPLSVVVHIDYQKAPLVVQRFGDIQRLVNQTLDPMVAAYFKNIGQNKTLIQLLQERSEIQLQAAREMQGKFAAYNLNLLEVLIGTPKARANDVQIETILSQLRERQVAREQIATYEERQLAATAERTLREAEAIAAQQTAITQSALSVQIRQNEGRAQVALAQQEAEKTKVTAAATAERHRLEGQGEAQRIEQIGLAQAIATAKQVDAYGGPQYQLASQVASRFAEAIERGHIPIVPQISAGGGDGMLQLLMSLLVEGKAQDWLKGTPSKPGA